MIISQGKNTIYSYEIRNNLLRDKRRILDKKTFKKKVEFKKFKAAQTEEETTARESQRERLRKMRDGRRLKP